MTAFLFVLPYMQPLCAKCLSQHRSTTFYLYFDPKKFGPKFFPKKGRKVGNCLDLTKVRAVGLALYS